MTELNAEIERKFVVTALPHSFDIIDYPAERILQGYLVQSNAEEVRIRRKGENYYLTYKHYPVTHDAKRIELETELGEEQFITLWPATEGRRLEKTRYRVPHEQYVIELDIFEGGNAGHMLAEVEFPSTEAADAFVPPVWFGPDVTGDKRYGNADIAIHGFPA